MVCTNALSFLDGKICAIQEPSIIIHTCMHANKLRHTKPHTEIMHTQTHTHTHSLSLSLSPTLSHKCQLAQTCNTYVAPLILDEVDLHVLSINEKIYDILHWQAMSELSEMNSIHCNLKKFPHQ